MDVCKGIFQESWGYMAFKVYGFWEFLKGYLGIYGTPRWIYGVEVSCTGDL